MNDERFKKLVKSIDQETVPPQGLKEKMLQNIMAQGKSSASSLSGLGRLIFERPLRASCALALVISGIMWAAMGNSYTGILCNLIRMR